MNPHKGDVALQVGDRTYTLRYSNFALVKLEGVLNKGLSQILTDISKPENLRLGTIVALLWAGLQKHHPGMSQEDVADLLDELDGGAAAAMTVIDIAFSKAFAAPGTKGTNPPQREGNGIGTISSLSTPAMDMIQKPSGISPREN